MKRCVFFLMIFSIQENCFSQKLTLNDLTSLCNQKNWENINEILINKGWRYYDSKKGDSYRYNIITWTYNKDSYSDKASAWFTLYTYEDLPNKITYQLSNIEPYLTIQNALKSSGFKLDKSSIEDNEVISTYSDSKFEIEISTSKVIKDDYFERSQTLYVFTIKKKSGVFDYNNGKKIEYYSNDNIKLEYTLKNGKLEGNYTSYYYDGTIKIKGNYKNGLEEGLFKEFDEYGSLEAEYVMKNGQKNGYFKQFKKDKITKIINFTNDLRNGEYVEYTLDDSFNYVLRINGNYKNDLFDGKWLLYYIQGQKNQIITFHNYTNGLLNGNFQDVTNDSLILGNYSNGLLNGKYTLYIDINKRLFGGLINTNISEIFHICDGFYYNGEKSGNWNFYDINDRVIRSGNFVNGFREGKWNDYRYLSDSTNDLRKTIEIKSYSNDVLEGISTRFESKDYDSIHNTWIYINIYEKTTFHNNVKDGPYEILDSNHSLISKGNYRDGIKNGEWISRVLVQNKFHVDTLYFKGNYNFGEKEGVWEYQTKSEKKRASITFKADIMSGDYIIWNDLGRPKYIKKFKLGYQYQIIELDSLGVDTLNIFRISSENTTNFKCEVTSYYIDKGRSVQMYKINKPSAILHTEYLSLIYSVINNESESNGYKDGVYYLYDSLGNILISGEYYKQTEVGNWVVYFYESKVWIQYEYDNGEIISEKYYSFEGQPFSGKFIYYDSTNSTKEIRNIKNGVRDGKTKTISLETNRTIKTEKYKKGVLKS